MFSAQAAIDRIIAVTAKPGSSQAQQPPVEQDTHDSESQAATENMLATQNDMLNTVTQLLQQTDSVSKILICNVVKQGFLILKLI